MAACGPDSVEQPALELLPGQRLILDGDALLIISDDDTAAEASQDNLRRCLFASRYLSRNAWTRPSRHDVLADAAAKPDLALEDVLAALRRIPAKHWVNHGRRNVRPAERFSIDSITLGLVTAASTHGRPMPSKKTWLYPNLCKLLLRFWRQHLRRHGIVPAGAEDAVGPAVAACTSIQLNRNYAAREHVDRNNLGPSWLVAAGDWTTGGQLWVEDPDGEAVHTVTADVHGPGAGLMYCSGQQCRGRDLDVRGKWVCFDGRKMHFVRAFGGGDRFSMVFFCTARHDDAPPGARDFLSSLGFAFPPQQYEHPSVLPLVLPPRSPPTPQPQTGALRSPQPRRRRHLRRPRMEVEPSSGWLFKRRLVNGLAIVTVVER